MCVCIVNVYEIFFFGGGGEGGEGVRGKGAYLSMHVIIITSTQTIAKTIS